MNPRRHWLASSAVRRRARHAGVGRQRIVNIFRQQQTPRNIQPPLRLKHPELNALATDPLSLAEYDALLLQPRKDLP